MGLRDIHSLSLIHDILAGARCGTNQSKALIQCRYLKFIWEPSFLRTKEYNQDDNRLPPSFSADTSFLRSQCANDLSDT